MSLIQRGKKKIWHYDVIIDGQRIRQSTDTGDRKLAENILAKIRTKVIEQKYYPKPLGEDKLFCEMMERFVKEHKINLSRQSQKSLKTSLNHLLPVFSEISLSKITPSKIIAYQQKRLKKAAPASINKEVSHMSKAFSTAIKWDWIEKNPCARVESLKTDNLRVRYLMEGEVEKLYSALPDWLKPIVTTARYTGLRLSNIIGLKWSDVNLFSKTIIIGKTKNGEPLGLPMNETVFHLFKSLSKVRHINSSEIFLGKSNQRLSGCTVSIMFSRACKKAGIKNFRFHDLRHDFCSRLVQSGVDIYTVAALAGHKNVGTTQRYAHLSPEKLRQDISVLDSTTQNSHTRKKGMDEISTSY